jgi:hypothetical protein
MYSSWQEHWPPNQCCPFTAFSLWFAHCGQQSHHHSKHYVLCLKLHTCVTQCCLYDGNIIKSPSLYHHLEFSEKKSHSTRPGAWEGCITSHFATSKKFIHRKSIGSRCIVLVEKHAAPPPPQSTFCIFSIKHFPTDAVRCRSNTAGSLILLVE